MLINTLYLFLQELLPVFFCCSMLYALADRSVSFFAFIVSGLGCGFIACVALLLLFDPISQFADGTGIELLLFTSSVMQLLLLTFLIAFISREKIKTIRHILIVLLAVFSSFNLLNFFIFFSTLWSHQDLSQPLLLGTLIGAGFSASLSVLLYFFLYWIRSIFPLALVLLPVLFFTGQLANNINLLAQIGLIETQSAWSTSAWLSDDQAIAQILSGLIGYEATPSILQIIIYLCSLLSMLAIIIIRHSSLKSSLATNEASQ